LGYQIVIVTAARFGLTWITDNHFGRPKDFVAAAITALIGLKYDMVRLRGVIARADGFVIERVERAAEALFGFDAVTPEQLGELLEGHLDALPELFG
jgi:hypothetical protein